jgi:hypothetical protein
LTADDLNASPKRRPVRIGVPPCLDLAIKEKAKELSTTYIKVLTTAASIQITEATTGKAQHQTVKTPNGGTKEPITELPERAIYLDDDNDDEQGEKEEKPTAETPDIDRVINLD